MAVLLAFVLGMCVFCIAVTISRPFMMIALERAVQPAVSAGLYKDCMQLLQNWPTSQDRIFSSDSNFDELPASIKMLEPEYVANSMCGGPPNIGICKNGFGGFSKGIRVFRTDEDAMKFSTNTVGSYTRIAPGIYIWWHPT